MDIKKLGAQHALLFWDNPELDSKYKEHTKLSIEFAISVLEEIFTNGLGVLDIHSSKEDLVEEYKDKIQELKQYLDGSKL